MKVKCIDAVNSGHRLKLHQIYEAKNTYDCRHYYLDGVPSAWSKDRFITVSDDIPDTLRTGQDPSSPLNDRKCPSCPNDRCSSNEKSCWVCGAKL